MLESVIAFLIQTLSFYLIGYALQRLEEHKYEALLATQRAEARVLLQKLRCVEDALDMMLAPVAYGIPVVDTTDIVG